MLDRPQRKPLRWQGFDYRIPAFYFVTICTAGRQPVLAAVRDDGVVVPSAVGQAVLDVWAEIPGRYPVAVSAFVLMPDHLHAILWIEPAPDAPALGSIIGAVKSLAWQRARVATGSAEPLWQRGYHDRVIRSDNELARVHAYIAENPTRWLARQAEQS